VVRRSFELEIRHIGRLPESGRRRLKLSLDTFSPGSGNKI
jgi:hypothetical protein